MKIKWFGHACFLLTSDEGVRVLTDPYDPGVGYPPLAVEADIVTVSHQHGDHNFTKAVKSPYKQVNQPGEFNIKGIQIQGIPTFHDEAGGSKRGENIIFRFTIDGLNLVHCGDLGHALTKDQVKSLGKVDVLLVPVGGFYTIDATAAAELVGQLQPALTIPMHFKTSLLSMPIAPVEPFLSAVGGGRHAGSQEIAVTPSSLKAESRVVVLDFPTR
jgi:L-ascorbate metabolism protein UlaG (beta-lactamase superfamily)